MSNQSRRDRVALSCSRSAAWLALLAVVAAVPMGAIASVGLSSVRAQTFGNEDLLVFQPWHHDRFGWSVAAGDFNADGAMDLATGIPSNFGTVGGGLNYAGIVVVRWGIPGTGLALGLADTVLSQHAAGSQGAPEPFDEFGYALAVGDFNGDGGLAVSVRNNVLASRCRLPRRVRACGKCRDPLRPTRRHPDGRRALGELRCDLRLSGRSGHSVG
jgi:hypothetical protein